MTIKRVAVAGAGTMGQGLAQTIARSGLEVLLIDSDESLVKKAIEKIGFSMNAEIARWGLTESEKRAILSRITTTTKLEEAKSCQIVIETIPEKICMKKEIFSKLDQICPPETVLITNTATLSVTEIAAAAKNQSRIIGVHFLNPVPKTSIAELVRGRLTSDSVFETTKRFLKMIEKTPVHVFECPGYITTRITLPMINEAIRVLAEGIAPCADIDNTMKLGIGLNMGPLSLADIIGLDTIVSWMENLHTETGEMTYVPAKLLRKMVRLGWYGAKSGRGFYRYDSEGRRIENSGVSPCELSMNTSSTITQEQKK
ncbi:MAG: 3-hydroxybutyryl-CoA dehydrogenase [Candidatus Riflebacteria bacterium]|nr:3-hydroxybutyryl-CoA dehydrogenase [Candidatus Riflebacteria bacterium]